MDINHGSHPKWFMSFILHRLTMPPTLGLCHVPPDKAPPPLPRVATPLPRGGEGAVFSPLRALFAFAEAEAHEHAASDIQKEGSAGN